MLFIDRNSIDPNIDVKLESVSESIKQNVGEIVGEEPNVTFVQCAKSRNPLFHDWLILTNYRAITSGDSFNYFNERGEVKTGGFGITISSLAKRCDYVQERVIKTFCAQLENDITYAIIIGDKKSNFIKFSNR